MIEPLARTAQRRRNGSAQQNAKNPMIAVRRTNGGTSPWSLDRGSLERPSSGGPSGGMVPTAAYDSARIALLARGRPWKHGIDEPLPRTLRWRRLLLAGSPPGKGGAGGFGSVGSAGAGVLRRNGRALIVEQAKTGSRWNSQWK